MHKGVWTLGLMTGMIVFSAFKLTGEKDDWKQGADKEGIKVYTRKSEQGKIRISKAEMFLPVPAAKVIEALLDFESYAKWFPSCIEAKILKRVSDNEFVSHLIYKTPWPFPNLDCVQRMVIDRRSIGDTVYIKDRSQQSITNRKLSSIKPSLKWELYFLGLPLVTKSLIL